MLNVSEDKGPPFQPGPLVQNIADRRIRRSPAAGFSFPAPCTRRDFQRRRA